MAWGSSQSDIGTGQFLLHYPVNPPGNGIVTSFTKKIGYQSGARRGWYLKSGRTFQSPITWGKKPRAFFTRWSDVGVNLRKINDPETSEQERYERDYYEDNYKDLRYFHCEPGNPFCTSSVEHECQYKEYDGEPD